MSSCIGYARVSTDHQNTDHQCQELLKHVSKEFIFVDTISGKTTANERPGFRKLLKALETQPDVKTLYVYEMSRIGRTYYDTFKTILSLEERGIAVVSLSDKESFLNDCTNPTMKRMMLSFMISIAEMERDKTIDRVKSGLDAAKKRGVRLGQPTKHLDLESVQRMRETGLTLEQIASELGIHVNTLRKRIHGYVKP